MPNSEIIKPNTEELLERIQQSTNLKIALTRYSPEIVLKTLYTYEAFGISSDQAEQLINNNLILENLGKLSIDQLYLIPGVNLQLIEKLLKVKYTL